MPDAYDDVVQYIVSHQEQFYRVAYSHVRSREDALDVVQNAICKALEHQDSLRNPEAVKSWFYRILVNEAVTMLRKAKKETPLEEQMMEQMIYEEPAYDQDRRAYDLVTRLPEAQRTVIILRYYEEMSLGEIAEITGAKLSTVKTRLYSALEKLNKFWKEAEQ